MKKKVLLLSTCAITSLAVAGGVVLLSNNDFNANKAKANTDFGLVRESVVAEDDYLTASCIDGKGNSITTQFTGFTLANEYYVTTQANSVAYFTNVNPMRGISNIYFTFEKESETTHSINFAVYASSNPLKISDINSGVHTDLFFLIDDYVSGTGKTITRNFSGLNKYRYVLVEVFTNSDAYTLTELNYNVVCEDEPEVVEVETKTTWSEEEAATLASYGAPSNFPYPGVSGYNISNSQQMGVMVQTLVPHDNFLNITSFAYQEGYIVTMNVEAEGRRIMYMQKQNEDKSETYTYGFNFKEMPGDLYSLQYLYSTTMEYMGESSSTWPKDKIAEVSANLATAFPDFQLDGVNYQIVNIGGNPMSTDISIMVSSESSMVEKYVAYFNGLDKNVYNVMVNAGGYSYASTKDGQYSLSVYDMGSQIGVTLTENKVYDHLPINEYAQYREYKLPEFTDVISGTFYFKYGDIVADSVTDEQFNQIVKLFTDIGFVNVSGDPNSQILRTPLTSNYDYNYLGVYVSVDSETREFRLYFEESQKDVNTKLSDALLLMTHYDDFNDYVAPITYEGEITSIRYRVAYIENATSDTIQEVFNSINVAADSKYLSEGQISFNVTIDGEERVTIIEYALVDGVLYFTNLDWGVAD
jgi:hypothetical protein